MNNKQQFRSQYVVKQSKTVQPPLLYRMFKRFEIHRHAAVADQITQKDSIVLDIGCGGGDFLFAYQNKFSKISGVDLLEENIHKAQSKSRLVPTAFSDLDAGSTSLPFENKSYDLVTSLATLQYLVDLELVFQEVHRVLKKDGYFIFEVPNFLVVWRRIQLFFGHFPHTSLFYSGWDGGVIHYFTYPKVKSFAESMGFKVVSLDSSGIFSKLRNLWPSLLGANIIAVCKKR